jgi:predicted nucleic acid-binding protein
VSVFVDTSALYAVLDRDDGFHPAARQHWLELLAGEELPLLTNYVLAECFALVLHDDLLPVFSVHWIDEEDHRNAVQAVLAAGRRDLSLVDCSSFAVMRRLRLRNAFSFDAHFQEQGFQIEPAATTDRI